MKKYVLLAGLGLGFLAGLPQATLALSPPIQTQEDFPLPLLVNIVKDSSVDMSKFQMCLRQGDWVDTINQSIIEGDLAHLTGVPETLIFTEAGPVYKIQGANREGLETLLSELKSGKTPSSPPVILPASFPVPNNKSEPGWGDENAPVRLAVYVDLACKYCRDLDTILLDLEEKYHGFIQITYRDYPLTSLHPQAYLLAHTANCAHAQGRYWDFIEQLYRWTPKTTEFETHGITEPKNSGQYQLTNLAEDPYKQKLTTFNWFTGKGKTVAENLDIMFPELAAEGVILQVIAKPTYPDSAVRYAYFQAVNPAYELQPKTNFYKLDTVTGVMNRMKISALLPANTGNMEVNTTETKLAWSPVKSGGVARELYVFDLITDKRTLVKTLPIGQTFDTSDGKLLNFSSQFEWLDEKTLGYKVYNAKTKTFIKDGLVKLP